MADYGFVTTNLLSTSTSQLVVKFSSPQTGVIAISTSPISTGGGGSFTFPSGAEYYYFENQSEVCINVDLSKYYVLVMIYNPSSVPVDFTLEVDGTTLSVSAITSTSGVCGYVLGVELSNGLDLAPITCCSFQNVSVGATSIPLYNACTCDGASCSGCPTSGGTSSLLCSAPSTTTIIENEAFLLQKPTTVTVTIANEAFFIQPKTVTVTIANEAFFLPSISKPSIANEAFFLTKLSTVVVHITIPEFIKFISIPQAIYNVIKFTITSQVEFEQPKQIVIGIQISPQASVNVSPVQLQVTQKYEEEIFESFMAIPALYYMFKFLKDKLKKRGRR